MTKWSSTPTKQQVEDRFARGDEDERQAFRRWLSKHDEAVELRITIRTLRGLMMMIRGRAGVIGPEHEFRVRIARELQIRINHLSKKRSPRG